jgi:hypothetical protein
MSRHPVGDRPMTVAERQRRYLARREFKAAFEALSKLAGPKPPVAGTGLVVKVEHLRRYPDKTAPWLHQQLGHRATLALRDALSKAIAQERG